MPYVMCPLCGGKAHENTANINGFHDRHPEIEVVGFGRRVCRDCGEELSVGDGVVIRGTHPGKCVVRAVGVANDGFRLYRLEVAPGHFVVLPRNQLRRAKNA